MAGYLPTLACVHHPPKSERQLLSHFCPWKEKQKNGEDTRPAKSRRAHRYPKAARIRFDTAKLQRPSSPSIADTPSPQLPIRQGNKPSPLSLRRRRSSRRTPQHCRGRRLETPELGKRFPERCKREPPLPAHDVLVEGLVVRVWGRQPPQAHLWAVNMMMFRVRTFHR